MLFDENGANTQFKLCKDPADRRPSDYSSVLYLKNGKYIKVRIPLPLLMFIVSESITSDI